MDRKNQGTREGCCKADATAISRRTVIGSSGMAVLGALSGSAFGRESAGEAGRSGPPKEMQERMEQSRVFSERMRNASGPEEIRKIFEERSAWERKRAIEDLKEQLGIADQEWPVIRPRVEAVYNLVHPQNQFGRGNAGPASPLEQKKSDLRELLQNKEVKPDQIKAGLAAVRAAKEKANQELARAKLDLRQIMTLRQEAVLVLNGLLD